MSTVSDGGLSWAGLVSTVRDGDLQSELGRTCVDCEGWRCELRQDLCRL